MKNNEGFFFVDTALTVLVVAGMLVAAIQSYTLCLKNIARANELSRALNYCENALMDQQYFVMDAGWSIQNNTEGYYNFSVEEIRVLKNDKVIFNLVEIN